MFRAVESLNGGAGWVWHPTGNSTTLSPKHPAANFTSGWSSLAARRAHNAKVDGSNPSPDPIYRITQKPGRGSNGEEQQGRQGYTVRGAASPRIKMPFVGGPEVSWPGAGLGSAPTRVQSSQTPEPIQALKPNRFPAEDNRQVPRPTTFHPRCRGSKDLVARIKRIAAKGGHIASAVNPAHRRVHGNMPLVRRDSYFLHPSQFFLGQRHLATDGQSQDGWRFTFIPHQNSPTVLAQNSTWPLTGPSRNPSVPSPDAGHSLRTPRLTDTPSDVIASVSATATGVNLIARGHSSDTGITA